MNWWQAVILGLVEGITEYLPVSSTGHLILTSHFLGLHRPEIKGAVNDFEVVIQGGAILAVLGLYFPRFVAMLRGVLGQDAAGRRLLINIIVAFIPAAAVGLLAKDWINANLFRAGPVIIAMIVGGVFMIAIDWYVIQPRRIPPAGGPGGGVGGGTQGGAGGGSPVVRTGAAFAGKEVTDLTVKDAAVIGLLQIFSLWPGTSRSMMTICGGVLTGLRPAAAAEFSFLLGMPTLLAATGYSLLKNLRTAAKTGEPNLFQTLGVMPCVLGMLVAAVSAWLAVKWLVAFLNRHGLAPFGYYRLVVGAVLIAAMMLGGLEISK